MNIHSITKLKELPQYFFVYSLAYSKQKLQIELTNQPLQYPHTVVPEGFIYSQWYIEEMDCPVEQGLIYQALSNVISAEDIHCNLMQRILSVTHKPEEKPLIEQKIKSLGMTPKSVAKNDTFHKTNENKVNKYPLILAGLLAFIAEILHWYDAPLLLVIFPAISSIALCGLETYKKGWIAIRHGNLNINALMSVAVTGAMLIGNWPEAAMVMFLFTIAEWLERFSIEKAHNAVQSLITLTPEIAKVQLAEGQWQELPVNSIATGTVIQIKPGERLPLDGKIISGTPSINQSPITGESLPVEKQVGDFVYAGSINQNTAFTYQSTVTSQNTTLARIIKIVESAQGSRPPIQRFIDKFASIYTPIIFLIALIIGIVPPLLFAQSWLEWIYKGLVILVIACPCALVLSTPVTIISGLTTAARLGILVKGGIYLEQARKLKWLALDKTGTITQGKPTQTYFYPENSHNSNTIKQLAISLAIQSDHPVSKAICNAANLDIISIQHVSQFTAIPGRGTKGLIDNEFYYLGNPLLFKELGVLTPEYEKKAKELEQQGNTVILFANSSTILAVFAVADAIRNESMEAISQLHQLGIKTMMLTGDNASVSQSIANKVNIDLVYSNLLPEDKLSIINNKTQLGEHIAMVGDGINDAPALAKADIGFAMGGIGTGTAIETADVTLMDDDLRKIPTFIRLSAKTHRILIENIILSLGIKIFFLLLTIFGLSSMWMAVFADVGTTLLVIFNGLRLLYSPGVKK